MRARLLILLVRSVVCQIVERIEVALPRCVGLPEDSPQPPVENIPLLEANARCCLLSRKKDTCNFSVRRDKRQGQREGGGVGVDLVHCTCILETTSSCSIFAITTAPSGCASSAVNMLYRSPLSRFASFAPSWPGERWSRRWQAKQPMSRLSSIHWEPLDTLPISDRYVI